MYYENGTYEKAKKELVIAKTTADAYSTFMKNHSTVYSAWVDHYTTQRGDIHYFNNFSGKPY